MYRIVRVSKISFLCWKQATFVPNVWTVWPNRTVQMIHLRIIRWRQSLDVCTKKIRVSFPWNFPYLSLSCSTISLYSGKQNDHTICCCIIEHTLIENHMQGLWHKNFWQSYDKRFSSTRRREGAQVPSGWWYGVGPYEPRQKWSYPEIGDLWLIYCRSRGRAAYTGTVWARSGWDGIAITPYKARFFENLPICLLHIYTLFFGH